jgi:predicted branched-subunit amino acid permease
MDLFWAPKILLGLVGFLALAIAGWRRRAISRGACVLLVLTAVVSLLPPYPPTGILAGLAIAWAARSARTQP